MSQSFTLQFSILKDIKIDLNQSYSICKDILHVSNSIGQLNFTYENVLNNFKIQTSFISCDCNQKSQKTYEISSNMVLLIYITSLQQLSLIQLFLWKYKQEYLLQGIKLKFIFIQNYFETGNTSPLWQNLGCLAAHMGFQVQSVQVESKQEFKYDQSIDIYHLSTYPSFDTQVLIQETYILPQEIRQNQTMALCLVTAAALHYQNFVDSAHILPMIYAINAIFLESNLIKDDISMMIEKAQLIYNNLQVPQDYENVLHIPIHMIQIFGDKKKSLIEFQQMCDLSYYNKVEFMCMARNIYKYDNSVMSFSSRSGKSTTMYSLYYYDLFSQNSVPVYLNLADYEATQPLYQKKSFEFDSCKLTKYEKDPKKYFNQYYNNINSVIQSINLQSQQTFIYQSHFYQKTEQEFQCNISLHCIMQQLLKQQLFSDFQSENRSVQLFFHYLGLQYQPQGNPVQDIGVHGIQKDINLYVDECLSKQSGNYKDSVKIVVQKCQKCMDEFIQLIQDYTLFDEIFELVEDDIKFNENVITIKGQTIKCWIKMLSYDQENIKQFMGDNIIPQNSQIISYFKQQKKFMITEATEDQKYYLVLNYFYAFYDELIYTEKFNKRVHFIDKVIIESPQFANIKKRQHILIYLFELIREFSVSGFQSQLDNVLFQFIMSLYNPRGIETLFWKTIQYHLNYKEGKGKYKSYQINLNEYYGNSQIDSTSDQIKIAGLNQQSSFEKNFMLVAGTDFSLINFVRQNQLCYSTESSRLKQPYIQTSIVPSAQPHPSVLSFDYYQFQRVSLTDIDTLKDQITLSIQKLSFNQYYVHLLPEKTSEMQILCALISPQILFKSNNENKQSFLLNQSESFTSSLFFNGKILNADQKQFQLYQYKLITDQIIIQRVENDSVFNQVEIHVQNKNNIYFEFNIQDFHTQVVFVPSTIYNKEVMTIFSFKLSQQFFAKEKAILQQKDIISVQQMFPYDSLNECNSILLFILTLTGNDNIEFFQNLRNITQQSLYLSVHTFKDYAGNLKSTDIWSSMKAVCKDMQFMILQQSYDEFMHLSENQDHDKNKKLYFEQSFQCVIESFKILKKHQQLNSNSLIILSVIDKQKLETRFQIADYILTIISDNKTLLDTDLFGSKSFNYEPEQTYYIYQIQLEYGVHYNQELFKKLENSNINSVMQLGCIVSDIILNEQYNIQPFMEYQFKKFYRKSTQIKHNPLLKDLQDIQVPNIQQWPSYFHTQQYLYLLKQYNEKQNYQKRNYQQKQMSIKYFTQNIIKLVKSYISVVIYNVQLKSHEYLKCDVNLISILSFLDNYEIKSCLYYYQLKIIIIEALQTKQIPFSNDIILQIKYAIDNALADTFQVNIMNKTTSKITYQQCCLTDISLLNCIMNQVLIEYQYSREKQLLYLTVSPPEIQQQEQQQQQQQQKEPKVKEINDQKLLDKIIKSRADSVTQVQTVFNWFNLFKGQIQDLNISSLLKDYEISKQLDNIIQQISSQHQQKDIMIQIEIFDMVNKLSFIYYCELATPAIQVYLKNCIILAQEYDILNKTIVFGIIYISEQLQIIKLTDRFLQKKEEQKQKSTDSYNNLLKWAQNHFGDKQYLQLKSNQAIYNAINQDLFQIDITLNDQLDKIFKLQQNIDKIAFYDIETKIIKYQVCQLVAFDILQSLRNQVIIDLKVISQMKTIVFSVASIQQPTPTLLQHSISSTSIQHDQTSLQKIIFWLNNYSVYGLEDPEKSIIENYIQNFQCSNLTSQIAASANLELFAPNLVQHQKCLQIIQSTNQFEKMQECIKISQEPATKTTQFSNSSNEKTTRTHLTVQQQILSVIGMAIQTDKNGEVIIRFSNVLDDIKIKDEMIYKNQCAVEILQYVGNTNVLISYSIQQVGLKIILKLIWFDTIKK